VMQFGCEYISKGDNDFLLNIVASIDQVFSSLVFKLHGMHILLTYICKVMKRKLIRFIARIELHLNDIFLQRSSKLSK
jgi:hypothetical protein